MSSAALIFGAGSGVSAARTDQQQTLDHLVKRHGRLARIPGAPMSNKTVPRSRRSCAFPPRFLDTCTPLPDIVQVPHGRW